MAPLLRISTDLEVLIHNLVAHILFCLPITYDSGTLQTSKCDIKRPRSWTNQTQDTQRTLEYSQHMERLAECCLTNHIPIEPGQNVAHIYSYFVIGRTLSGKIKSLQVS